MAKRKQKPFSILIIYLRGENRMNAACRRDGARISIGKQ